MMVTGSHGVRMQYDYVSDIAGLPGRPSSPAPRWLRLVREGDTIAGYDSADGIHWARVGTATLAGLSRVVQVGLFATSPQDFRVQSSFGGQSVQGGPSLATGVFDHVRLSGAVNGTWTGGNVGSSPSAGPPDLGSGFHASAGTFAVSGSGDIGPIVPGPGGGWYPTAAIEQNLAGAFIGLIAILVVAAMFFTAEYRRGLIRITLAASPRRGQVLAAKAIVAGLVTFAVGLVAVIVSIAVGVRQMRSQGLYVLPVSALTEARVIVGTAAMLGVMAVFAVALGAVLRRSAITITVAIVAIVLPFLFAALNIFPYDVTNWLLRVTPAAGFAIEQSIPHYSQVNSLYQPANGSYPLPPLAGFAVLCAWTAAALMLALILLRRRDA
jgi:ABC-type transport system involved in multi-copper enzyme maturation permease subunit